jgi:hypothetical protein
MKRTELKRKTPLRAKSPTARRKDSSMRCSRVTERSDGSSSRCTKRGTVIVSAAERHCRAHGTAIADKLVGDFVRARDKRCQLAGINGKPCSDERLWWCHLLRKGTYPSTRWTPGNSVAGCAGHHLFLDNHQAEWLAYCIERLGQESLDGLLGYALAGNGPSAAYVIRAFREGNPNR